VNKLARIIATGTAQSFRSRGAASAHSGFVIGTEFNNWRERVQANTTSSISHSPTFVNSRMLRPVCAASPAVTGFVG
jgi:hypothetical protein